MFFESSNLKWRNLATKPLNGPCPPPIPPSAGAVDESFDELDGFDDDIDDDVAGGIAADTAAADGDVAAAAVASPEVDEAISIVAGVVVGA